jgi:excisionase family DNA binding protein
MYFTTGEAAKHCGVQLNTIKNWIRNGQLAAIQTPGGHWRIPRDSFLVFMEKFNTPITPITPEMPATKHRILVIDDEASAHDLVVGALEIHCPDCDVHSAYDGYSGLINIGRLQPHLIILDIMMPDINGLEIIHRLKATDSPLPEAQIIAITAASDRPLVINRIRQTGIEALLFKPLDINALIDSVHKALSISAQTQTQITQARNP